MKRRNVDIATIGTGRADMAVCRAALRHTDNTALIESGLRQLGRFGHVGPLTDSDLKRAAAAILAAEYPCEPHAAIKRMARNGVEVAVDWLDGEVARRERFDDVLACALHIGPIRIKHCRDCGSGA